MSAFEIGAARQDLTRWRPGLGMMGWGMLHNYATSVATPLSVRAFVIRDATTGACYQAARMMVMRSRWTMAIATADVRDARVRGGDGHRYRARVV